RAVATAAALLLVYFSASVWWSSEFVWRGAFTTYSRCVLIAGFVVGVAMSIAHSASMLNWLTRGVTIAAALAAIAALFEFQAHPTWDGRLAGLGQLRNSVVAALTFAAALLIALDVALNDTQRWRIVAAVCLVAVGAALFATGSRNGYVTAGAGVWVASLVVRRPTRVRIVRWLTVTLVVAAAAFAFIAIDRDVLADLFPRGDSFRMAIWSAEWQRYADGNPWFGLGVLTSDRVVVADQTFAHPHSLYLASALQGGLVGLVLLLSVLGCTVGKLVGNLDARAARLGLSLIAAGAVAYAFDGWELIDKVSVSWLVIWLPVGLALGLGMGSPHARSLEDPDR
ncbi:MAG TPA: O-antigen ligase family protein, partial [Pseudomonadales bacterium]|nr:O-antigen ligase family protein [Pseudomonadales bacterium]